MGDDAIRQKEAPAKQKLPGAGSTDSIAAKRHRPRAFLAQSGRNRKPHEYRRFTTLTRGGYDVGRVTDEAEPRGMRGWIGSAARKVEAHATPAEPNDRREVATKALALRPQRVACERPGSDGHVGRHGTTSHRSRE